MSKNEQAPASPSDAEIDTYWRQACEPPTVTTQDFVRKFARTILARFGALPAAPATLISDAACDAIVDALQAEGGRSREWLRNQVRTALAAAAHASVPGAPVAGEFDVRRILLSVVPGDDGMGVEVFAKSVDEVVDKLTELDQCLEEYETAAPVPQHGAQASREPTEVPESTALADVLRNLSLGLNFHRRQYGEIGSRDVDVAKWNKQVDELCRFIDRAVVLAAPVAATQPSDPRVTAGYDTASMLCDLLATIHHDDGKHTNAVGLDQSIKDAVKRLRKGSSAEGAEPVAYLSSKQLRGIPTGELKGTYLPFRKAAEGLFDTPVYLAAAPVAVGHLDAARLDWLEKHASHINAVHDIGGRVVGFEWDCEDAELPTVREDIDAALQATKEGRAAS